MARTHLVYGKYPQMPRLAQEIITDQQSAIELMQPHRKSQLRSPTLGPTCPFFGGQFRVRLKVPKRDRPWVVVQNNDFVNRFGTLACYTTSVVNNEGKEKMATPTNVLVKPTWKNALFADSYVVCGHIYTIRPEEFKDDSIGWLSSEEQRKVAEALRKALRL